MSDEQKKLLQEMANAIKQYMDEIDGTLAELNEKLKEEQRILTDADQMELH